MSMVECTAGMMVTVEGRVRQALVRQQSSMRGVTRDGLLGKSWQAYDRLSLLQYDIFFGSITANVIKIYLEQRTW